MRGISLEVAQLQQAHQHQLLQSTLEHQGVLLMGQMLVLMVVLLTREQAVDLHVLDRQQMGVRHWLQEMVVQERTVGQQQVTVYTQEEAVVRHKEELADVAQMEKCV